MGNACISKAGKRKTGVICGAVNIHDERYLSGSTYSKAHQKMQANGQIFIGKHTSSRFIQAGKTNFTWLQEMPIMYTQKEKSKQTTRNTQAPAVKAST